MAENKIVSNVRSPEENLIETMRQMLQHHTDCLTDDSRPSSVDGGINLIYHKAIMVTLRELIDQYDDDVAAQNAPKEGMKAE